MRLQQPKGLQNPGKGILCMFVRACLCTRVRLLCGYAASGRIRASMCEAVGLRCLRRTSLDVLSAHLLLPLHKCAAHHPELAPSQLGTYHPAAEATDPP